MNFAFYDEPYQLRGWRKTVDLPRRLVRRLQRPFFYRLRDLLTFLYHKQLEANMQAAELRQRLAAAEQTIAEQRAAARAFAVDYLAVTRRLAHLEDLVLTIQAEPAAPPPAVLPLRPHRAAA